MSKPLDGIKILELSHVVAAPFCGMLLGDLGAEIIKVEKPGEGEYSRFAGPVYKPGISLWYPSYNRNKKAITVDYKQEAGKEIILRLAETSDIVLENFRPGLLRSLGLDYESLRQVNPRIIVVSLSGFGQTGPYSQKTAFDMTISAIGGLMALTGETDGIPMKVGTSAVDFIAGLYGAIGALSAVRYRDLTGNGQQVDVSMLAGVLSILETSIPEYLLNGVEPRRPGNRRVYTAPCNIFPVRDGYVYIAAFFQNHWKKLCEIFRRSDLIDDPRFCKGAARKKHETELESIILDWVKDDTVANLCEKLETAGVPCAPVNTIERIVSDPHVMANRYLQSFDYPGIGEFTTAAFPIKFSEFETEVRQRPALLGEHNREILIGMLGFSEEEYETLCKNKVV